MEIPHPRVVICGYYGFGNTGDELILAAMLHELRALRPGLAATVISGNPASTMASHGVNAVHWQDAPAIAAQVSTADVVLVGGGGLFQEYSGIDPDSLFTDRHYAITFYAEPAILGGLFGRPVMLYAMGVGPLTSEHGRRMVRAACDAAQVITLRDEESARLLASLGIESVELRVTADPVFALTDAAGSAAPAGLAQALPTGPGLLVAVSLRHWSIGVASYFWERELAAGLDAFLETHEARLLFVPFQRLDRAPENDTAVAERVRSLLRHPERATVLSGDRDPSELRATLGRCDLVVGMRLHAMILAAISGVPGVALSYDSKVDQAMRQIGAEQFVVPLADIEARTVALRMGRALSESKASRKDLGGKVAHLAELARSNAAAAIELLDRGSVARNLSPALSKVVARTMTARFEVESTLRGELAVLREAKIQTDAATAELERARAALGADLATRSEEARRLQEDLSRKDGELTQASSVLGRQGAELQEVRVELAAKSAELKAETALRGEMDALREAKSQAEIAVAELERAALGAELRQVRADLAAETTELEENQDELSRLDEELAQAKSALERRDAELRQIRADLVGETEELEEAQDELARQDEELAQARSALERQATELERSHVEAAQLRDRVASVHGELLQIHQSRLWKVGTRYWRFLRMIGRLPARNG